MQKTLVGFCRCTCAEGSVTVDRAYNCTVAFTADGDYTVTYGKGGADGNNQMLEVEVELAADNALGSAVSTLLVTDVAKRLLFRNTSNGVLTEPAGFAVSLYRMSPAINGS